MIIEKMSNVVFTEEEVLEALMDYLAKKFADKPEQMYLLEHVQETASCLDFNGDDFTLLIDGLTDVEEIL